ncbi:hypothetical protein SJAV_01250 [Sulfurisphaera javensis]|uniref:Membrane protein 6-pyruvoyl-tetrahydropterin synthase-related domain-containing protein n=1 Tax=Sulfurisphaera javensis TaxID=2049879 RepID=A0AAT9GMY8_9CREN
MRSLSLRYILPPVILSILVNFMWYRGLPIYAGDQGILLANGVNVNYLIQGVLTAYTNYPYGFVPVVPSTAWVNLIFVPFSFLGNLGEEVLSTILTIIGSVFLFKLALRYYSYLSSLLSLIIYLTNWYIYEGFIEAPYIFWSQTIIYFLLPLLTYYLMLYGENEISNKVGFPIVTVIITYLLASSGEIFPIAWLGFTLLTIYFLRKRIFHAILIILFYTVSQLYWVLPYASVQIPHFSNITNSSLAEIIHESSTPLIESFSSLMPSVTPISYNLLFIVLVSFIVLLSFIFAKNKDLKFFSLLLIIIVGFDSVIYTPFYPLVKEAVLTNGFFAVLRTTQFATETFAGLFLSLLIPSVIPNKYRREVFALLLLIFIIFNFPVASGSLSERISVPNYYLELIQYLNSQQGDFTIAVFPTVCYGWYSTSWYYGNNIYLYYSKHPVIVGGIYSGYYFYSDYYKLNYLLYFINLSDPAFKGSIVVITNILYLLNVKYIVIEGDAGTNISFIRILYLPIKPYITNLNLLGEKYHLFQFVKAFGPLYLYKVNLNSSYVFYTNVDNISITSMNLTQVLKPAEYKWISNTEIQVSPSSYKYVFLTFAYSPFWRSNFGEPKNVSNFNLYYTGGKGIVIYDTLQGKLMVDDAYALVSILMPIGIGFVLDKVQRRLALIGIKLRKLQWIKK